MIYGLDFIQDLLGLIDMLKPVVDLMLRMQPLHCSVWKLKQYWPRNSDVLTQSKNRILETCPTLPKVFKDLNSGETYKSVTRLESRLISEYEDGGNDNI